MATLRQKKLAKAVVDNFAGTLSLNKQELVASVGYSPASADKKATEILGSKGVQEELGILGFSVEEADKVIANLLKNGEKEETQIKAAQEIYKRLSAYAPEKSVNLNINTSGNDQALSAAEKAYLAQLDGTTGTTEST